MGARFALLECRSEKLSLNFGVALQAGLEGHRSASSDWWWGFGVTARAGPTSVSRGGFFFPFLDTYALVTLAIIPTPSGALATAHAGLGISFNAYAIESKDLRLALIVPNLEIVWSPPTRLDPTVHGFELRAGIGF